MTDNGSAPAKDLCIGCGACAGICPRHRLSIEWNSLGLYEVRKSKDECPQGCHLCMDVCPLVDGNPDEDVIGTSLYGDVAEARRVPELGYCGACFVGYSRAGEQRWNGASGGLTTWFLTRLMRDGIIDRAVCVTPHTGAGPLFQYAVCDSVEEIESSAKSAYYPVEMSQVVREIQSVDGRYAVVALPCFAKALRLVAEALPPVKRRLVCILGLTCGHTVSTYFADYAAALAGGTGPLSSIVFRGKTPGLPASDLAVTCTYGGDCPDTKTVHWSQGPGRAWSEHWFTPRPCIYCDDVFAEVADVAFMDAWLPKYTPDHRGTNLVVARSGLAEDLLQSGLASGELHLERCSVEDVVESQAGVIANKRQGLAHRLWLAGKQGDRVPKRRVSPRCARSMVEALHWQMGFKNAGAGVTVWKDCRDAAALQHAMEALCARERALQRAVRICLTPRRLLGMLKRAL